MMPGMARMRRVDLDARLERAQRTVRARRGLNRMEMRDPALGIVTSGIAYQYVREALPEASVLKLGITNPLPDDLILDFTSKVERVAVVEELGPYLSLRLRVLGVEVVETGLPAIGELSPVAIGRAFGIAAPAIRAAIPDLPPRPPLLCPGCPHRGVFHALGQDAGGGHGRHRVLHARGPRAAQGDGQLRVHGREHRHGARYGACRRRRQVRWSPSSATRHSRTRA